MEDSPEHSAWLEFTLLLQTPALPSAQVINQYLSEHLPGSPQVVEQSSSESSIELQYDVSKSVQLELSAKPFDPEELGPVCEHAWWWPEAAETSTQHTCFLSVRMQVDDGDIVEAMVLLTILTSAVAALSDALAVYWADGALVHSGESFIEQLEQARSSQPPIPLTLWVSLFLGEITPGKITLSTIGMSVFDYPELEIVDSDGEVDELLQLAHGVALHMLETDIIHDDGETLELASGRKVSIHHAKSIFNDEDPVLRLEMN